LCAQIEKECKDLIASADCASSISLQQATIALPSSSYSVSATSVQSVSISSTSSTGASLQTSATAGSSSSAADSYTGEHFLTEAVASEDPSCSLLSSRSPTSPSSVYDDSTHQIQIITLDSGPLFPEKKKRKTFSSPSRTFSLIPSPSVDASATSTSASLASISPTPISTASSQVECFAENCNSLESQFKWLVFRVDESRNGNSQSSGSYEIDDDVEILRSYKATPVLPQLPTRGPASLLPPLPRLPVQPQQYSPLLPHEPYGIPISKFNFCYVPLLSPPCPFIFRENSATSSASLRSPMSSLLTSAHIPSESSNSVSQATQDSDKEEELDEISHVDVKDKFDSEYGNNNLDEKIGSSCNGDIQNDMVVEHQEHAASNSLLQVHRRTYFIFHFATHLIFIYCMCLTRRIVIRHLFYAWSFQISLQHLLIHNPFTFSPKS
jgi:DNA mismatch repair ATPase MutL